MPPQDGVPEEAGQTDRGTNTFLHLRHPFRMREPDVAILHPGEIIFIHSNHAEMYF